MASFVFSKCIVLGARHVWGHGFHGFVLIAIEKMEILSTFPHLQDNIKVIRRYEGWYNTRLVSYYIIFHFETDWSRIRPLPSTTLTRTILDICGEPHYSTSGSVGMMYRGSPRISSINITNRAGQKHLVNWHVQFTRIQVNEFKL